MQGGNIFLVRAKGGLTYVPRKNFKDTGDGKKTTGGFCCILWVLK